MRNEPPDQKTGPQRNLARNTALTATVLLAPGGFILGGLLIARAIRKRRAAQIEAAQDMPPSPEGES